MNPFYWLKHWERLYELEYKGAHDDIAMLLLMAEMVEEGRHYIGVTITNDHEYRP